MGKVFSSAEIIQIAEDYDTSGKINMWANIIKYIILIIAGIVVFFGLVAIIVGLGTDASISVAGLLLCAIGIIHGFFAFFVVYLLRGFAIITEAASLIVLEHKDEE